MEYRLTRAAEAHSALLPFIQENLDGVDTSSKNPHINPLLAHERMRATYMKVTSLLNKIFDEKGNLIEGESLDQLRGLVLEMKIFNKERAKAEILECR